MAILSRKLRSAHTPTQPYKRAMSAAWGLPARSASTTERKRQREHERWAYFRERGSWPEWSLIPHFNFSGETGTRRGAGNLAGEGEKKRPQEKQSSALQDRGSSCCYVRLLSPSQRGGEERLQPLSSPAKETLAQLAVEF